MPTVSELTEVVDCARSLIESVRRAYPSASREKISAMCRNAISLEIGGDLTDTREASNHG